jgi:hypothetical protein
MESDEMSGLVADLCRIAQSLRGQVADSRSIEELLQVAGALGVSTSSRRDDAPVFLDGTERVETATWTQCGGLLFALVHDDVREPCAIAARVAQRLFELAPTHR